MIRLLEIPALILIVGITYWHSRLFAKNRKVSPLFHTLWAAVYIAPVIVEAIRYQSWWLFIALTLERFVFYNPILNKWRGKFFFYLSVNSLNPSLWDRLELRWVKAYPYVWVASFIGFIAIQFYA